MRSGWIFAVMIGLTSCARSDPAETQLLSGACQDRLLWIDEAAHGIELLDGLLRSGTEVAGHLVQLQALSARSGTGVLSRGRDELVETFAAELGEVEAIAQRFDDGSLADGTPQHLSLEVGAAQGPVVVALPDWTLRGLGLEPAEVRIDHRDEAQDALIAVGQAALAVSLDRGRLSKARAALGLEHRALEPGARACGAEVGSAEAGSDVVEPSLQPLSLSVLANLADGREATSLVLKGLDAAEQILQRLRGSVEEGSSADPSGPQPLARSGRRWLEALDDLAGQLVYGGVALGDGSAERMDVLWSDGVGQITFSGALPDLTASGLGLELWSTDGASRIMAQTDAALAHLEEQERLLTSFDQVLEILQDLTHSKE